MLRGYRLRDLIIVEYCHTADSSGIFREYCAAIAGSQIIPQALVHNRNWITKWEGRLVDSDKAREQRAYVDGNPHAQWLKETFDLAKIGYGRIDYGLKDGLPQVWEINTNPMIVRRAQAPSAMPEADRRLLEPVREAFIRQLRSALAALDSEVDARRSVPIEVSPTLLRQLDAERRQRRRRRARRAAIARVARAGAPMWLLRALRAR